MKVHTETIHFSADMKLIAFIEKKLQKLEQIFDRILDASVVLKLENTGQIRDKIAEVKINIPGSVIFIKETSKSFEAAIDMAVEALKRQLIRYKQRADAKK
jgi:putative sigma-54 modulation protein